MQDPDAAATADTAEVPQPAETADSAAGLAGLGWDDTWATAYADAVAGRDDVAALRPARVARAERGALVVDDGLETLTVGADPGHVATTGDWVVVDGDVAVAALPRRTVVSRAEASGRSVEQVLAANVDVVAVVVSLAMDPDLGRMERLLSLAWASGAQPLVVLTKADLAPDAYDVAHDVGLAAPGADVLVVSAETGVGLEELAARLWLGRTVVLLGQSGVGKSTLVNALAGRQVVATGAVGVTGKGRHVTTSRELVRLDSGAVLLDTPGLRGVGLTGGDAGVEAAFPEIDDLAQRCRFGDCGHASEPGCAVLAAVESGDLPQRRLDSWRKLMREVAWMERRGDARLMAEERRRWKQVHLSVRNSGTIRY